MRRIQSLGLLLLLLCAAGSVQAHDTWVQSLPLRPLPAQPLLLELSAGHGLQPLSAPKKRRLRSLGLIGRPRQPVAWVRLRNRVRVRFGLAAPGLSCAVLTTDLIEIEIPSAGVDAYLAEVQPAAAVLQAWQAQRARAQPWRERYAKDAKAYFRVGAGGLPWKKVRALGQTLEIVALRDPTRLRLRSSLRVELRQHGQPVPDAALRLFDRKGERLLRTDAAGRATLALRCRGRQLIATTLLQPPAHVGAAWSSRFATLSFSLP
jgi:hypothetical protein